MPNLLCFGAIFSCVLNFRPFIFSQFSPHSLPLPVPSPIAPAPLPKEVNKKLSYRGQNALSVTKHTNAITIANIYCIYPYVTQSRPDERIMFSTCPFVRPSVCLFVCHQLVNAILRKRMNRFQCKLA